MAARLQDQVALITGAAQGIGRVIALRLAEEGAHVVLADLAENVDDTAQELQQKYPGNRGFGMTVDVTKSDEVDRMVEETVKRLGQLDIMVNNAGVNHPMTAVTDLTDETFDRVIGVNFRGTFNGCRAAARVMPEQKQGCIVNIGSWYGKQGFAYFGVYCASKAAVIRFTESLALEMAPHAVRVNSICPGNMATDMHWDALREEAKIRNITFEEMDKMVKDVIPLGKQGRPEDIASTVVYLASEDGAYVTGQAINVNGGCLFH
ncbi:MAG: SDR family oxidoreductase [Pirellulaceae bacterium]|nr:SDR family oxidoreductase [Pirellulaceae bacterium]